MAIYVQPVKKPDKHWKQSSVSTPKDGFTGFLQITEHDNASELSCHNVVAVPIQTALMDMNDIGGLKAKYGNILNKMDEYKLSQLSGKASLETLKSLLKEMAESYYYDANPEVANVIAELEMRLMVEMAKCEA